MTATKGIFVILGVAAVFVVLVWLNSPRAPAALEIVASSIFGLALFSRTYSRERWALALFAFISLLFLLTGLGDFWLFGGARLFGGFPSDGTYRSIMIAGIIFIIGILNTRQLVLRAIKRGEHIFPSATSGPKDRHLWLFPALLCASCFGLPFVLPDTYGGLTLALRERIIISGAIYILLPTLLTIIRQHRQKT